MGPSEDRIIIPPQGGTQCPDRWDNEPLASAQRSFSCPEPKLEAPGYTTGLQSPSTHTQCPPGSLIAPFDVNFAYVLASLSPFPRGDPGPHGPPWGRPGTCNLNCEDPDPGDHSTHFCFPLPRLLLGLQGPHPRLSL